MDIATLVGLIMGIVAVLLGMFFKHVAFSVLLNPAAFFIIIIGTAAAVITAFPGNELKKVPKLFKILFTKAKQMEGADIIKMFVEMAQESRKNGILSLEAKIAELEDPFLKRGINFIVDGQTPEFVRNTLTEEIEAMEERHHGYAGVFTQAGTYAPTLGVLGAVIGLIAALGNMGDTDALGHAISAAFVATMLGIYTGYVLWHPFGNKLKRKSKSEAKLKYMMIEGILCIQSGLHPAILEAKMVSYLPESERAKVSEDKGDKGDKGGS
ncbi:flagellar motor stator protein MotA [Ectobacillus sp. JY-23]|uniref:flagellar motor stator protein MotA n=1 Tax=Ectobacillus sp. JY-23 TaxID=2933872 RepID=UPI001FF6CDC1|nr:flagellar motor stator protein MotA [Ectobacillus sp. JY-23]UOY92115.1 flagellar motor stator protein MotA [Ectobacillus sp. JY-23]